MKIALGLSGGVDSAVAALRLKAAGHEVTGVMMRLWREGAGFAGGGAGSCFGPDEPRNIAAAAEVAERVGIPFRVFDCHAAYVREVVENFRQTYLAGRTPNPCVRCNARVKFGLLPQLAREQGVEFERFATGHYARTAPCAGCMGLWRARDLAKDQSYFLSRLSQEQLRQAMFPLGDLTKKEVRALAREAGLEQADRADSQDFYAGGKDELVGRPDCPGDIVDLEGKVLGTHRGYWHYTVGQRRGIGLSGAAGAYFVVAIDPASNLVRVGPREAARQTRFEVEDVNWVSCQQTERAFACFIKIRSTGEPTGPATFDGRTVVVPEGVFGVAPGQSVVCYGADGAVLCGGVISTQR